MLSCVAAAACGLTGGGGERSAPPALAGWSQAIGEPAGARFTALPAVDAVPPLVPGSGMLVVDPWWRLPTEPSGEPLRQALRQFVEQGGNLVLFGHAAHLVAELGIEAEYPERELFRWGYDARTTFERRKFERTGDRFVRAIVNNGQLLVAVELHEFFEDSLSRWRQTRVNRMR